MIIVANGIYSYGSEENKGEDWQDNLNLGKDLAAKMDQLYPGLLRRVEVRNTTTNRYNQDLSQRSLLLGIGDYHNSTQEALKAADLVADSIAALLNSYH